MADGGCVERKLSRIHLMVAVAQLVEQRVVVPWVAGSSPVSHPKSYPRRVGGLVYFNLETWLDFLAVFGEQTSMAVFGSGLNAQNRNVIFLGAGDKL